MLGFVMFTMGLTLRPIDFGLVARRPLPVLLGIAAQFIIMPTAAVLVTWALKLPPELAAGVILVGCAPGGTASNVVAYLAKGDVALSVTMTSVSTLLAPIAMPLLSLWLAGHYLPVDAGSMAWDIAKIVLIPVLAGLILRHFIPTLVSRLLPSLPWLSVSVIALIVAIVVAGSAEFVISAGALVIAAVFLHNLVGMSLGYVVAAMTRQPYNVRRTMAVEVGMQNSGLAAGLAAQYMNPVAALPAALFSIWHNMSGALFAMACRRVDRAHGRAKKAP